jgi:fused signal recognition particle receptor
MFDKLRTSLNRLRITITGRELTASDIDRTFDEIETDLLGSDMSIDVIEFLKNDLKLRLIKSESRGDKRQYVVDSLRSSIMTIFDSIPPVDLHSLMGSCRPFVITLLGINGTGKTTTLAKLAYKFKHEGLKVVVAAADTYRAGAIEQLTSHTEKLGVKLITQPYGTDAAALSRDAVSFARSNLYDVVLLDTAGRMQTNLNLLQELEKIIRVSKSNFSIFIADALAGNDMLSEATTFMGRPGFDGSIVTKVDADVKGGSLVNLAWITKKPILYLGTGQSYGDLVPFNPAWIMSRLF